MPVSYEVKPELECVFVHLYGVVDNAELLQAQEAMFRDPLFKGQYSRLVDATGCGRLDVDALTVLFLAKAAERRGLTRAALVSGSNDIVYGLMRMYEGYASTAECEVFRKLSPAVSWLTPARYS